MRTTRLLGFLVVLVLSIPATSASAITVISPRDGTVVRQGGVVHFGWTLDSGERGVRFYFASTSELTSANWTTPQGDGRKILMGTPATSDFRMPRDLAVGTYLWKLCVFHTGQPDTNCSFTQARRLVIALPLKHIVAKHKASKHPSSSKPPPMPTGWLPYTRGYEKLRQLAAEVAQGEGEEGKPTESFVFHCRRNSPRVIACEVHFITDLEYERVTCGYVWGATLSNGRITVRTLSHFGCEPV